MYAVVKTGGKQYRVEQGQRLRVERVGEPDSTVELPAVLLVDGDNVIAGDDAAKATVSARVVDEGRGRKIQGFTYKNKSNQRRRWGHRQAYSTIEITGISAG
ncbi:MAG: 50S ribosomal protein L21 [Actinomycetia bacterium]|nr:50S ribosomal protein L21 [Actinomycetes bacterium]